MNRRKFYTGIGSRETPSYERVRMTEIATRLRSHYTLRSGGADGADEAFALGAAPYMSIFLPWKKFNGHVANGKEFIDSERLPSLSRALLIAADVHAAWHMCDPAARKLHARNCMQVLGAELDEPSKFVVCWTLDGRYKGGTRTALVLAERNGIPVANIAVDPWMNLSAEEIVSKLTATT